ncbi:MAG: cache domain-containing protein, partial [Methylococcaceae bacterium]|nr:cache domain-containing protein [Methylococcaceae bacterium]
MENTHLERGKPFFSLRWKLLGTLVILSFGVFILLAHLFQLYLLDRSEETRRAAIPLYALQINGLILQQRRHLEQVAMALPTLSDTRTSLTKKKTPNFKHRFDDFWSTFQLDMGLDDAHYFDADGKELAVWNNDSTESLVVDMETWRRATEETFRKEAPTSFLSCIDACGIHALAPVLINGRVMGQFAVGSSLAEMVLAFRNTSNADVIVMNSSTSESHFTPDSLKSKWGVRIQATSNPKISLEILQQASQQFDLPTFLSSPTRLEFQGKTYEAAQVNLDKDNLAEGMHILLLKDISLDLEQARETAFSALLLSLSGGGLSLLLLHILLDKSLKRLLHTAGAIPLLGKSAFAELRKTITPRGRAFLHDEIDILGNTAVMLSWRLESLERAVAERTHSLQTALGEIYREKNFVANLLDHAQVIIVTHSASGGILSLNRYVHELAGYTESQLHGVSLLGSPLLIDPLISLNDRLQELITGKIEHLRHEAGLKCFDGSWRDISWVHTRLNHDPD